MLYFKKPESFRLPAVGLTLFILFGCGGGGDDEEDFDIPVTTTGYAVEIDASQIVQGARAPETASATANLSTSAGDDIFASGTVTVTGVTATSVTINAGYAGETGPVAVTLQSSGGSSWAVPANTTLDIVELRRLESTGYYVSVDSAQGRMRGQILPTGWDLVVVDLDGSSVVPPVATGNTAKAGFAVNGTTGDYRARISTMGITGAISASVREAYAGGRGDVVISLEQSATDPNVWGTIDINDVNSGNRLNSSGLDRYGQGKFHASIETMTNLDGEVRGQLIPEGVSVSALDLSDAEVVVTSGPPVVSAGSATGHVTYVPGRNEFAVSINTDLLAALSVFIHEAPSGQNGTGIFSLMQDQMVPGNWVLPATTLTAQQEDALNTEGLYISVVTSAFMDGELRGQIILGN